MNSRSLPKELELSGTGPIRVLTLNRPDQFNAVTEPMHRALGTVWADLADDPDVRVVILTGAGRAFCAGGDFATIDGLAADPGYRYRYLNSARRIVREMVAFPLPIVAAINGPAVGLGASLGVLCDVVFMADRAFISDPHVSLGVVAADGGALAWPAFMSLNRAKEYLFTGDRIGAADAERLGLANRVVPAQELMPAAQTFAERLAAQPRQALQDTKRTLNLHLDRMVRDVVDFAFAAESETFGLPGFTEGLEKWRDRPAKQASAPTTKGPPPD